MTRDSERAGRTAGPSEISFQAMLEAAPDAMVGVNREGTIVMVNVQTEKVFGYEREDLLGQPVELLVPDRAKGTHARHRESYFERPRTRPMGIGLDLAGRRADGTEFPAEISLSTIESEDGVLALAAIRDVTDRRRAEVETTRAREEADRASRAKNEFLSRMSHELRTPLNSILGFGQLLKMDDPTESQDRAISQILSGGEHLLDLINEILDISRIESGQITLSLEPVHLVDVLEETLQLVTPMADQFRVRLTQPLVGEDIHVRADRQRLKQVFLNLLSNAVKYNDENGEVRITCESRPGAYVRIGIVDTGQGIPEQAMEELFAPFERLGAEVSTVEGTGLGLALSKGLVEAMRGSIGVKSVPGTGSTFWIDLPLAQDHQDPLQTPRHEGPIAEGPDEAKTVLYIEDNLANLRLIEGILAHRPAITLMSAMQGRIGLDLARQHRPDLILLDLHLPDIPGQEVLRALLADEGTRSIPVVVISADASRETFRRLSASGAEAFLTKPLNVHRFLEAVDTSLAQPRV